MAFVLDLVRALREERRRGHPLLRSGYAYVDRPNPTLARMIPAGVRILDIGCGGGTNLAALVAGGRTGAGVELDADAAGRARRRGLTVHSGDVRDPAFRRQLVEAEGTFDVLLFADVLEHLVAPHEVLQGALPLLAPGGVVVVSMPNVAVWYQRLALLVGRFEYDETGILDRTHLRFFTRSSLRRWLVDCGLEPVRWGVTPSLVASLARFLRPLAKQRSDDFAEALPGPFGVYLRVVEPVEHALCSLWPGLLAFQHVVVARPVASSRPQPR